MTHKELLEIRNKLAIEHVNHFGSIDQEWLFLEGFDAALKVIGEMEFQSENIQKLYDGVFLHQVYLSGANYQLEQIRKAVKG